MPLAQWTSCYSGTGCRSHSVIGALSGGRSCRIAAEEPTVEDEGLWTDGQHELTYVVRDVISAR